MTEETKPLLPPSNEEYIASQNAIIQTRIEKMNAFKSEGVEVYATGYRPDSHAADLKAKYENETHESLEEKNVQVKLGGRIMAVRNMSTIIRDSKSSTSAISFMSKDPYL